MSEAGRVVSLASILVDLAVDVPRLPARGGDVVATGTRAPVAAGGFTVALAVARQYVDCIYAGAHGTGPRGDLVRSALRAEGIAAAFPARPDADTGFCVVMVEPNGERTFVTSPGAESVSRADQLASLAVQHDDLIVVSGYDLAYPESGPVIAGWLDHLRTSSSATVPRVVLDPGPLIADIPPDVWTRALRSADILSLNQREARILTQTANACGAELLDSVMHRLGSFDGLTMVLREGDRGCVAGGGLLAGSDIHIAAPSIGQVVDTTGAGDVHTGVLLARLARGEHLTDALTAATEVASLSVTQPGPVLAPDIDHPTGVPRSCQ